MIKKPKNDYTMTRALNQPVRPFFSLLDDWFQDFPARYTREISSNLQPVPVNITESPDAYHLEMNAPGRNKEDFKIQVENDLLTISFEQKENKEEEDQKVIRREFVYKSFKRSFTLDDRIDASGIQAKYEQGVLKLYLPKKVAEQIQPKQIAIQ
jgi:HSP20 family protein